MQTRQVQKKQSDGLFSALLALTGFFLLFEISFFIQCNQSYLTDLPYVKNHINIPPSIWPAVLFFVAAQLMVHLFYCAIVWWTATSAARVLHVAPAHRLYFGMGVWLMGVAAVLLSNQYFFPNSHFADLTAMLFVNKSVLQIVLVFVLICCAVFLALSISLTAAHVFARYQYWLRKHVYLAGGVSVLLVFVLIFLFSYQSADAIHDAATEDKPNIIVVGVDSLRPDFLGYFGRAATTPFFDDFLNHATVFAEAVTPLARTFPSWSAILTGQYPLHSGIRTNLAARESIDLSHALPRLLQQAGYTTVYATDEARFSNIDHQYGFDRVIAPEMGLKDFLLGTFNDFPFSNLLINTKAGQFLFPYSYANRPVYVTYQPDTFLRLIAPVIKQSRDKPLFLAIHFCLPHHPYIWADLTEQSSSVVERYAASIRRVDRQVRDFFVQLESARVLDHAIVVLLSDHGEALALSGDRITEKSKYLAKDPHVMPHFYPQSLDHEAVNQSAGHGTDVLGLPQYHTVLAVRQYGAREQPGRWVHGVVSLLDVKPTLMSLIHVSGLDARSDGESLAAVVNGGEVSRRHAAVFLESDFTPAAIRTAYPEMRQVMLEGIQFFQVDPQTLRLSVKPSMEKMIISTKQYADIDGEWMLAYYPQGKFAKRHTAILVNLNTGQWTDDLMSLFAKQSPAQKMRLAMKSFYGEELAGA